MKLIKFEKIISFSSEDQIFKSENLLLNDNEDEEKKWLCESSSEKQLSCVIQLEKLTKIDKIEICNYGCAFIEILVSRSGEEESKFHVFLPITSFMNPKESKEKVNLNRLKSLNAKENFIEEQSSLKWDRIKVICSQPFNKTLQFGLKSIKVYGPEDNNNELKINTGIFSFKKDTNKPLDENAIINKAKSVENKDESNKNEIKVGSVFSKWKQNKADFDEENKSKKNNDSSSQSVKKEIGYGDDSDEDEKKKKKKEEKIIEKPKFKSSEIEKSTENSKKIKKESEEDVKKKNNAKSSIKEEKKSIESDNEDDSKKKVKESEKEKVFVKKSVESDNEDEKKPLNNKKTVLKGVTFVLSGFINPERGDLRNKAIELGARYKPDWDDSCSHLICAFSDTPKYNQVKDSGGTIVNRQWIPDCYSKGKFLDTKLYAFENKKKKQKHSSSDSDDNRKKKRDTRRATTSKKAGKYAENSDDEEENSDDRDFIADSDEEDEYMPSSSSNDEEDVLSDDDDDDDRHKSKKRNKKKRKTAESDSSDEEKKKKRNKKSRKRSSSSSSSSSELKLKKNKKKSKVKSSSSDSEEDKKKKKNTKKFTGNDDVTPKTPPRALKEEKQKKKPKNDETSSTDVNSEMEEDESSKTKEPWELPDLFSNKNFFIFGDFKANDIKTLNRIIVAYGGTLNDYMSDKIDFVITDKDWNDEFDKSLQDNTKIKFVNSDWLHACATRKKLIAFEPFAVLPRI